MLRFLGPEFIPNYKKCLHGKKGAIFGCGVFGWFVGDLSDLLVVCGWFGWFVGNLWVVWLDCGWFKWFVGGFEFYS